MKPHISEHSPEKTAEGGELDQRTLSAQEPPLYVAPGRAWMALRRTMPPWSWEKNLEELVAFCHASQIDEVIVKVDAEDFSHGQLSVPWLEGYLPILQKIATRLGEEGIVYSLNPWITLLHCDRGRSAHRDFPGMQTIVGHDGIETKACGCPLCPEWRQKTAHLWRLYASTAPRVLWVEDDIRLFNHLPARFGCFCPLHLEEFARRTGQAVSREELVSALLAPSAPHPLREKWLRFQGETMVETVQVITEAVHAVNPKIFLGLMSSGPDLHALEGRDWHRLAKTLQGCAPLLVSRPPLGIYAEFSLRGFYYGAASIRKTRKALPPGCVELTEVESFPFSTFGKSVAVTFLQLAASCALGCDGVTMNLFDHLGNPIADTPEYGGMLDRERRFLDALASRSSNGAPFAGVGLLQNEDASIHRHLPPGADYATLADDGSSWAFLLEALGIAVTWNLEEAPVMALCGQTVRALPASEIERLLGGGILCDLAAAQALIDLGYGPQLGATISKSGLTHEFGPLAAEELCDVRFGGTPDRYLTATLPDLMSDMPLGILDCDPRAVVASRLVDCDRNPVCPLLTLFENALGGRVAILPYDIGVLKEGNDFLHPYRREQLHSTLRWLARGELPFTVQGGAYALPVRTEEPSLTRLTVFNLSLDPWPSATLTLATGGRTVERVDFLESDQRAGSEASWGPIPPAMFQTDEGVLTIRHERPIGFQRPAAWCVYWRVAR